MYARHHVWLPIRLVLQDLVRPLHLEDHCGVLLTTNTAHTATQLHKTQRKQGKQHLTTVHGQRQKREHADRPRHGQGTYETNIHCNGTEPDTETRRETGRWRFREIEMRSRFTSQIPDSRVQESPLNQVHHSTKWLPSSNIPSPPPQFFSERPRGRTVRKLQVFVHIRHFFMYACAGHLFSTTFPTHHPSDSSVTTDSHMKHGLCRQVGTAGRRLTHPICGVSHLS